MKYIVTRLAISLVAVCGCASALSLQTPVCYFGECDEPTQPATRSPDPAPNRRPTNAPSIPPQGPPSTSPFSGSNLCIYGVFAVQVKDKQTCKRLYLQPSAGRKNGRQVDCARIAHNPGQAPRVLSIRAVKTVGDCFGTTSSVPRSARLPAAECVTSYPDGAEHYRFDTDSAHCRQP